MPRAYPLTRGSPSQAHTSVPQTPTDAAVSFSLAPLMSWVRKFFIVGGCHMHCSACLAAFLASTWMLGAPPRVTTKNISSQMSPGEQNSPHLSITARDPILAACPRERT